MRQAADANHTLADELVLLAVHGTLHLIGFDHDTAQAEENMWRAQNEALQAAGVAFAVPRFTFEDAEGATHEG
jgi:probable rRNA maturation factor